MLGRYGSDYTPFFRTSIHVQKVLVIDRAGKSGLSRKIIRNDKGGKKQLTCRRYSPQALRLGYSLDVAMRLKSGLEFKVRFKLIYTQADIVEHRYN